MKLSLKYRIAIVFFILAGLMMSLVLSATLSRLYDVNRKNLLINEGVIFDQIADLSRIALFTEELDDLQSYMEQAAEDVQIVKVMVASPTGTILVGSDVSQVGKILSKQKNTAREFWRTEKIGNTSGVLGTLSIKFSRAQLEQANQEAKYLGVKTAIFGLIVIAIAGLMMGHLLTRRLNALSKAASKIAKGDLAVRTNLSGTDEIAILGSTFDHMAKNISEYVNELHSTETQLRKAHAELEHRVAKRTAELAVARDNALEASKIKSQFLANVSHELRTPLNAIIGYTELMLEETINSESNIFQDDLEKVRIAGHHLLSLINDVLDLAKIEAGQMPLTLSQFDILPYFEETLDSIHSLSNKNRNEIQVVYGKSVDSMYADKMKVRQILINLVSNAIKFAPAEIISLTVTKEHNENIDWIVIAVRDFGPGIKEDKLEVLFDEFSQLNSNESTLQKGTGLGLAICKKYCVSMGGDIAVDSTIGVGTIFTVRIPVNVTHAKMLRESGNNIKSSSLVMSEN